MEGVGEAERRSRARETLEMVDLAGYGDRAPTELSGGQQQRVALARALVIEPDVLLLDEPLANLDLQLRQQMRFELQRLQDELGITTVYVTHDQQEALSMSDRILVMDDGRSKQQDRPLALYNDPANEFVADFIGEANLLEGTVAAVDGEGITVALDSIDVTIPVHGQSMPTGLGVGDEVILNVRPEDIGVVTADPTDPSALSGTVIQKTFYGQITTLHVDVGGHELRVDSFGRSIQPEYDSGDEVTVDWSPSDCVLLRRTT
jgi:ABC-type Fe3+/spermidine/putrescine transport system ATPase subunit